MGLYIFGSCNPRVPDANSADNANISDVIGNKDDTWQGDSIYAVLAGQYAALHRETLVYPTLAGGSTLISPAGLWTWGAYGTIVPAGTITTDYRLLTIMIESCTVANGVFELELYKGATDDLIAALRFAVVGGFWGNVRYRIAAESVESGLQIRGRLASSIGAATITTSIEYQLLA